MSDIRVEFSPLFSVAFFGVIYWYALVPAGLALGGIGWFGRTLPMALRFASWSAAVLCAAPYVLLLVVFVGGNVQQARLAAQDRALHRTLAADETVGTLFLPAGAEVAFTNETQRVVRSVSLPRPITVAGILLEGTLEPIGQREWAGTLARDQVIGDWPCRAGDLWFTPEGVATRCTLAEGHRLAGYDLPAGAQSRRDPVTGGWEFQLPQDGPALRIAALGADLPPGGTLVLAADGATRRLYVPHQSRMVVAGVGLYDHVILDGTAVTGELAEPTPVAGVMLPTETVVLLDLATGEAKATTRPSIIDP
jgi:hypothetical protein